MKLTDLKTHKERLELLKRVIDNFPKRAQKNDTENTFPFENFKELKEIHYPALTIPKKYGGLGISLKEMLQMQELIAEQDGSTALSLGWHMGAVKHIGETDCWPEEIYAAFAADVLENGSLINNAATERATGSPTRGGRPETTARKTASGWVINGRKAFTTLAPVLDYFIVSASIADSEQVGDFLIRRHLPGVAIDETWDSIAMRATGSHDLVLTDVKLKKEDLVQYLIPGERAAKGTLLHIPACYLGIAKAAKREALKFATNYSPNTMKGTIAEIPSVRQKIGEIELKIFESETVLYAIAEKWDASDTLARALMGAELGATKLSVVNRALEIVDLAMRIVGARSLSAQSPLQRYYRDVRAGLHNPPMDDMTIMLLASEAIEQREN